MLTQYLMISFLWAVMAIGVPGAETVAVRGFDNIHQKQGISRERELGNRLLHRLMDVAYETFKDLGGSDAELKEIQQKRARITTCYFQAISCY